MHAPVSLLNREPVVDQERYATDAASYLDGARERGFLDRILAAFDRADKFTIAFVGETIIDEYRYVSPLGKPAKECIIAAVETRETETFDGGVIAASRQAEWRGAKLITHSQAVIRKTRFVDPAYIRKLFEVYSDRDVDLTPAQRASWQCHLEEVVRDHDMVIAFDFGHGLIGKQERDILRKSKFLAVNAQTNTGNYGFNPITKYKSADYVCIDEPEARLAIGMQTEPMHWVLDELRRVIACQKVIITMGRNGCLVYDNDFPREVPAFATSGIDTMGAGDAFLSATAPLIAAGLDIETAAFVGNVAGAIKVGIVGHRDHVTRQALVNAIESLLK